eukprot:scaffold121466_cov54-Phaeocystis_antarctica.AAC.2
MRLLRPGKSMCGEGRSGGRVPPGVVRSGVRLSHPVHACQADHLGLGSVRVRVGVRVRVWVRVARRTARRAAAAIARDASSSRSAASPGIR